MRPAGKLLGRVLVHVSLSPRRQCGDGDQGGIETREAGEQIPVGPVIEIRPGERAADIGDPGQLPGLRSVQQLQDGAQQRWRGWRAPVR